MKKIIVFLLLYPSVLLAQYKIATPKDYTYPTNDTLKLLCWNVEHFVDAFDNPYIQNKREDSTDPVFIKERVRQLCEVIRFNNPDVLVLEEFESQAFAMSIVKNNLSDLGYRFFASSPSPDWYMNVVLISKVPLGVIYGYGSVFTDIEGFGESQNNINTRMWSVDVFANENFSFVLTGLHLKAGGNEKDRATRTGQINFLKEQYQRFLKLNSKTKIALVGDLNCTPDSEEFKKILAGKKNAQFIDPIANDTIFSHPADKPSRRIDHILLNPELKKNQIPNSAQIVNSLGGEKMRLISDHLPVMIQFKSR